MTSNDLLKWALTVKTESKEKRLRYEQNRLPKIDAYIDMIIARSQHIQEQTIKMQRYTEEIQDALTKLSSYGVSVPTEPKAAKTLENPLLP